jgi:hypothetical protein
MRMTKSGLLITALCGVFALAALGAASGLPSFHDIRIAPMGPVSGRPNNAGGTPAPSGGSNVSMNLPQQVRQANAPSGGGEVVGGDNGEEATKQAAAEAAQREADAAAWREVQRLYSEGRTAAHKQEWETAFGFF